jgi:hypothetical protein
MSKAERDAFVAGARWGWDNRQRPTRETWVMAEALRRYGGEEKPDPFHEKFARETAALSDEETAQEPSTCPSCGKPWDMTKFSACECGVSIVKASPPDAPRRGSMS